MLSRVLSAFLIVPGYRAGYLLSVWFDDKTPLLSSKAPNR
jgi:hypothetical protein